MLDVGIELSLQLFGIGDTESEADDGAHVPENRVQVDTVLPKFGQHHGEA
jgi:hypothetical protein